MKTRLILVGIEAMGDLPELLAAAREIAHDAGTRVAVVRAVGIGVRLPEGALEVPPDDVITLFEQELREAVALAGGPVPMLVAARAGRPADVLGEVARRVGANLLIVRGEPESSWDWLLPPTAARLRQRAPCPILEVMPPTPSRARPRLRDLIAAIEEAPASISKKVPPSHRGEPAHAR